MSKKLTKIIVLGTIALWCIYDIAIYAFAGVDSTISRVVLGWARDIPIIVAPPSVVIGHLFWPQKIVVSGTDDLSVVRGATPPTHPNKG